MHSTNVLITKQSDNSLSFFYFDWSMESTCSHTVKQYLCICSLCYHPVSDQSTRMLFSYFTKCQCPNQSKTVLVHSLHVL